MPTAVLGVLLLIAGCSSFADVADPGRGDTHRARARQDDARIATSVPGDALTVVADADPVAAAVATSRVLYRSAEIAVVARDGDAAGTLLGASAAVGLGVPLLLASGAGGDALAAEVGRLGVRDVLAVGDVDASRLGARTVAVPAASRAVASATGLRFSSADPVDDDGAVAAVAALDPRRPVALHPPGEGGAPAARARAGRLPRVGRPALLDGVVVLASGSPESLAGIATARAAGARVVLTGGTDPRASVDAVKALADDRNAAVVALGADFAGEQGLDWKVATARQGDQLPGGGQVLFPGRMLVALYGTPGSAALGVLGEQGLDPSIERARGQAAAFGELVDVPVVPAFEIIATVASSAPGPDGNYSSETDPEQLRPWVEKAREAGLYVVLDLQPGRTDFLTQARSYESLLELPDVGLALDPEWRLGPRQLPLQQIGSVGVDEVNGVATWLADLTREHRLPQKLLVVHQFQAGMIAGRDRLDTTRDELAVMIHADGQGAQGDKQATWARLHVDVPPGRLSWGWKNFYDEDAPMLTPQQTIEQVSPTPNLISYQ